MSLINNDSFWSFFFFLFSFLHFIPISAPKINVDRSANPHILFLFADDDIIIGQREIKQKILGWKITVCSKKLWLKWYHRKPDIICDCPNLVFFQSRRRLAFVLKATTIHLLIPTKPMWTTYRIYAGANSSINNDWNQLVRSRRMIPLGSLPTNALLSNF